MTSTSAFSPRRSPRLFHKYLKPGALAKLRDSKIKARHNQRTQMSRSETLLLTPSSPTQHYNEDNGVPSFTFPVNRPCCLRRKKLFAVTPTFTHTDTNHS
ncbi:hypothetical protein VNO78_30940 [Psophocarpus tetragonolobus]|uniref:Uncharacterized protein n=1 Tax=Psophocarpus tetragonolobus TaxID=3891 RepID=A0AAN9RYA5_PSOTE